MCVFLSNIICRKNMLTKEMEKVDIEQEREEAGAEMWSEESGE